jgi:hypothetical protein
MKTPSLKTLIRVVGVVLLLVTGLSLFFCLELVVAPEIKSNGISISQSLGYWPFFSLFLLLLSMYLIAGAPHVVRFIERKQSGEKRNHAA